MWRQDERAKERQGREKEKEKQIVERGGEELR